MSEKSFARVRRTIGHSGRISKWQTLQGARCAQRTCTPSRQTGMAGHPDQHLGIVGAPVCPEGERADTDGSASSNGGHATATTSTSGSGSLSDPGWPLASLLHFRGVGSKEGDMRSDGHGSDGGKGGFKSSRLQKNCAGAAQRTLYGEKRQVPMKRLTLCMFVCVTSFAHAEDEATTFPACRLPIAAAAPTSPSRADILLDRVMEGEQECNKVPMRASSRRRHTDHCSPRRPVRIQGERSFMARDPARDHPPRAR